MNDIENHKISTTYENSLIFKIFAFTFFNTFNSMIFISFFDSLFSDMNLCVVGVKDKLNANKQKEFDRDCFLVLSTQMKSNFLVKFFLYIHEMINTFI